MPKTPARFSHDAFAGTAAAYVRYRLPYPPALLAHLVARLAPTKTGRLLDLGCGPGRVALDLAPKFAEVWAIDLEPEMVAVGPAEAERRRVNNVRWLVGAAEALEAPAGTFDLVTAGEAFHRFDQRLVTARILKWLRPGGALAIMGGEGAINGDVPWQLAAQLVVRRFTDRPSPLGATPTDGKRS
jgi:SAM-dependent methyltransferase